MGASAHSTGARPAAKWKVAKEGTMFARLRKSTEVIVIVATLLAYGCPFQAIVHAFGLDERTVARWRALCHRVGPGTDSTAKAGQ